VEVAARSDDRPLRGLRVLDLSRVIAGPHCTRMLSDLGADVIKLEPPEGDQTRAAGKLGGVSSSGFIQLNVGKRLISVDLAREAGRDLVRRLCAEVDVLIENFRPGVMDAWKLDFGSLQQSCPRLIYVSISGYGQKNSWRHRRAYAPYVHAEAGYLHTVSKLKSGPIEHDPMSIADFAAAKDAAVAVLAAVIHRERTGRGQHIDVSLAHSILFQNEFVSALLSPTARPPRSGSTPQTIFTTSDGHSFSCGNPVSSQVFAKICSAFGCMELTTDERFLDSGRRRDRRAELIGELQAALLQRGTAEEVGVLLEAEGLVVGRVRTVADAVQAPWAVERRAVLDFSDESGAPVRIPSAPWRFSEVDVTSVPRPLGPGTDNRDVLVELLRMSDAEIEALQADGTLRSSIEATLPEAE
jgi:CoA:oxalate CoA-transferase